MNLYFKTSIYIKAILSVIEMLLGLLILIVPVTYITNFILQITSGENVEDPNSYITTHLIQFAHHLLLTGLTFISIYLLIRGAVKLIVVIGIFKNKLWAYPSLLVLIGLFILYQLYEILQSHSILLIGLTMFDLIVMWLTWREYKHVLTKKINH